MAVNTTWTLPTGATLDLPNGFQVTETNWDALVSNTYRLGGTDGNSKSGPLYIGGTSFVNAFQTVGVTVNQAGATNEVFAAKRTGALAHGMTTMTDTDTYGTVVEADTTNGGIAVGGYATATVGVRLIGNGTTDDTAKSVFGRSYVEVMARKKSGTGIGLPGANSNLFSVCLSDGATKFIVDNEGDLHVDGASTLTVYDEYDDAALLEAISLSMDPARSKNFKFSLATDLVAHRRALVAGGVLSEEGFLSLKGIVGLLIDGIRQVTHAHRVLEAQVRPMLLERSN